MNTYLISAERLTYNLDLEYRAMQAARTMTESEQAEQNIDNLKAEAGILLDSLMNRRSIMTIEQIATQHEITDIMNVGGKNVLTLFRDNKISRPEYYRRLEIGRKLKSIYAGLSETLNELSDAIEYLSEYLNPSKMEGETPELPFSSLWGETATSAPGKDYMFMFDEFTHKNNRIIFDKISQDIMNAGEADTETIINEIALQLTPEQLFNAIQYSDIENIPAGILEWLDDITDNVNDEFREARKVLVGNLNELV